LELRDRTIKLNSAMRHRYSYRRHTKSNVDYDYNYYYDYNVYCTSYNKMILPDIGVVFS